MGCICAGESDIENFLTDFIDELKIRKYNEKRFFAFIDKNSPFRTLRSSYDEFLRSNQNEEIHTNYQNILFDKNHHHFFVSLIFLINSDAKNMSTNYKLALEKVKNSHLEVKETPLEDFAKDDYDILNDVLKFYVSMISLDVVEATQRSKENRITNEQMKILKENYATNVIEAFVKDMMKDCRNPNVDHDEFFKKNFMDLRHPVIREKLKKIFENKDILKKENKNEPELVSRQRPQNSHSDKKMTEKLDENGNEPEKYKYTLPNIDYKGRNGNTQEHYGSNNYEKIQRELEENDCVESVNPGNRGYENNNIRLEMERLKEEQYSIYRRECLLHHNKIREIHGVPPLRESESLSEYSQNWANFISETDTLTHSSMIWDGKNVGENIAKAGAIINDPSQLIVHKWYEEKENFDYSNPSSQNNTKNFTQMIWKKTESVGFGLAYSESGNTFIVINYYPAGNTPNDYGENVTKPKI